MIVVVVEMWIANDDVGVVVVGDTAVVAPAVWGAGGGCGSVAYCVV